MISSQRKFVVVFQFGKVASTALVDAFSKAPNVDAAQSHFLGQDALSKMVPTMLSPSTSDYFFEHQIGQFVRNARVSRRINLIRSGGSDEKLVIVSVSREPLDWFRSAFAQDIVEYVPTLRGIVGNVGVSCENDGEIVYHGLCSMLSGFSELLKNVETVNEATRRAQAGDFRFGAVFGDDVELGVKRIFLLMLRPFSWFSDHFAPATGVALHDFQHEGGYWHLERKDADYFILRYEDLDSSLPKATDRMGISDLRMERLNVGEEKMHSREVRQAFAIEAVNDLRRIFSSSEYCSFFGY
jgi:hypothetical protein